MNTLIELVPKIKKTTAASIVVIFASSIVISEFFNPTSNDAFTDFPLINSSLIRSNVMTFASTAIATRSEEHTSELQSRGHLVCRLLLEKKNKILECLQS